MKNVQQSGSFLSKKNIITPEIILNADVSSDMTLSKRSGQTKKISLSSAHSLWSGSVMLCVSENKLCRVINNSIVELCDVYCKLSYEEVNGLIYVSGTSFTGIYNPTTETVQDWGISIPSEPQCSLTSGSFHPGRYCLCFTKTNSSGQISGSGSISEIIWDGDDQGINILNIKDDYLLWITDTNGSDFFLATVESGKITKQHYNQPLPSLDCVPPYQMSNIMYAHGRMWGYKDKQLYYSEPNTFDWWKDSNCFFFDDEIVMVAHTSTGLYVASKDITYALNGTDPSTMTMKLVGDGAIMGSLTYIEFGMDNPTLLPIWMSQSGIIVGSESMYPLNLTQGKLDIDTGLSGASLSHMVNGETQVLISMPNVTGNDIGNIFNDGKIF